MIETKKVRLLVVDDHPIVRDGLSKLNELHGSLEIVGSGASSQEAVCLARSSKPNVVLLDVRLPDGCGIEACRTIKKQIPEIKILLLTSFSGNDLVLAAMEAGADGYLLKENDAARIVKAIFVVAAGGTVFDPVGGKPPKQHRRLENLTGQEQRVLAEVASGKTDKEVAAALGLSAKTVRNYLDRAFEKLQVNTRTHATRVYLQHSTMRFSI